jgi:hypothetical protein
MTQAMRLICARNQCGRARNRKFYRFAFSPTKVEVPGLSAYDSFRGIACSILFGEELSWKYIS